MVFSNSDALRPGRHKTVTTQAIIDQIHEVILEGRPISSNSIATQLGISPEWAGTIIYEDLGMRKLFANFGPKMPERGWKTSTMPVV
jgi:hypothetical protein